MNPFNLPQDQYEAGRAVFPWVVLVLSAGFWSLWSLAMYDAWKEKRSK